MMFLGDEGLGFALARDVSGDGLAPVWRCGDVVLDLARPRIMGVVNVTPDSFSDGGLHASTEAAIAWGAQLLDDGADILDVGGESTRPGFTPVDAEEEKRRVVPVVQALAQMGAVVSIDTRHAEVARAALEAGARIVNDVSGFRDPQMVQAVAEHGICGCVCMHSGGTHLEPPAAQTSADEQNAAAESAASGASYVEEVTSFLLDHAHVLEQAGVVAERICLDCGPGFGKTADQDIELQQATGHFARLGYPYMCAPSRKRFVGALSGVAQASERDAATAGVCLAAAARGARVFRVHNVAACMQALTCAEGAWGAPRRQALVALGSNVGDSLATLRAALEEIDTLPLTSLVAASHAYTTRPAYLDDQPLFANAVALVETGLHPLALLAQLQAIELVHGRVRSIPNGPRTLDLDLLWMAGERHAGARLTLPHALMGERDFVLRPLADVLAGGDDEATRVFCAYNGIAWTPREQRVGLVESDLGVLWKEEA